MYMINCIARRMGKTAVRQLCWFAGTPEDFPRSPSFFSCLMSYSCLALTSPDSTLLDHLGMLDVQQESNESALGTWIPLFQYLLSRICREVASKMPQSIFTFSRIALIPSCNPWVAIRALDPRESGQDRTQVYLLFGRDPQQALTVLLA